MELSLDFTFASNPNATHHRMLMTASPNQINEVASRTFREVEFFFQLCDVLRKPPVLDEAHGKYGKDQLGGAHARDEAFVKHAEECWWMALL
ncbi:hypothetical protein E4U42_005201 [Claviceps africana]|uniref:Uncharacterized protein n=1 Tax=Claviceps africana TaxID=83212 RepID=A0A8K0NHI4_9HYPO|nr:hypothetical protein E4U42_005201 [Claviceps africana]